MKWNRRIGWMAAALTLLIMAMITSDALAKNGKRGNRKQKQQRQAQVIVQTPQSSHGCNHGVTTLRAYPSYDRANGVMAIKPYPGHPTVVSPYPGHPLVVHPPVHGGGMHGHCPKPVVVRHPPVVVHRPPTVVHSSSRRVNGLEIAHGVLSIIHGIQQSRSSHGGGHYHH